MSRTSVTLLLLLSVSLAHSQPAGRTPTHTLFLVGDAGEPYVKESPLGTVLRQKIARAGNATVLFLGDNVYPRGLPEEGSPNYPLAESALRTQVEFVRGLGARAIFIPGNHDWQHWGRKGLEYIRRQQAWLDSLHDERITLLPRDGCPGPVQINLDERNILVILDTQWFLHQWDKNEDADICNATTTTETLTLVEDIFQRNPDKRIIIAAHHPLVTYGEHGGVFTWKAHLFPLTEINDRLYIPLPVLGSIYPLYRRWFGHLQDTSHPLYKEFSNALQDIMRQHPGSVYVAGHEHALEYINRDSTAFVVSGAGAKTEYVKKKGDALFAEPVKGFVQVSIYDDGDVSFHFFRVDDAFPTGQEVFTKAIPAPASTVIGDSASPDFSGKTVRVKASDRYSAGKLKQRLLGQNYRNAWAQEIEVPVFDIGAEHGGLTILQRGGGQQTLSLRLADSTGHEYVLRSVEKYPEAAIPEVLRGTFAQDLVQDQISAAHPYAALVVAPMADAIGLYHTNPRLVYIPDDPRLGEYRSTFRNTLALFEERPDDDWHESSFFGNSEKIVSTRKVLEKLADDNDNRVDEKFVLRNRLFDLIIGDWDRHDDQWRWATLEEKKQDVFRPIPRDRDQTFFVNEGVLARLWSRRWALPKFEGFDERIDWPSGLSFNARHFDRSFLTRLSKEDWIATAEQLKADLTDEIIETSIRQWPAPIFALNGEEIIRNLKLRRDHIVDDAISHYKFLSREVEVTGSDRMESFQVQRLPNGDVHVLVHKITKKGEKDRKLYDRVFHRNETREIRLYGMGGVDVFDISGPARGSIRIRVIGGEGQDVLTDDSNAGAFTKKTWFYDQPDQGSFQSGGAVKDRREADPSVNEYDRTSFEYDRLAPLVWGQYNPDDGVFLGAGLLFLKNGFRKSPFSQRHLFLASVAPETQSYNFRYQGKYTELFGKWNLEVDADVKAPNYVNNFFGMGNESVFNRDIDDEQDIDVDKAVHYYRYRFEELALYGAVSRKVGAFTQLQFGPFFQRIEMERPGDGQDRFIEEYANTLPSDLFNEFNAFGGVRWLITSGKRDNDLFPRRGSSISVSGRSMAGLNKDRNDFSAYEGSLAFYHSFREESRLVFAGRIGAGFNTGEYPFYQAQVLDGKTELRGFRKTRFYGDSKVFGSLEMRLKLFDLRSYLFPASFGIMGFYDVGRIWYKNENSDIWHQGVGGGVWFTPFNLTVLSVEAGHSREGTLGYLRLGFMF